MILTAGAIAGFEQVNRAALVIAIPGHIPKNYHTTEHIDRLPNTKSDTAL
ncbi:hypothetical protein BROC_00028 [Candidatus Brocadiaceae bacterium]|nr:hypothetical protein BROC_00028 [Candidatus Brocadiaceae bacterium]